MQRLCSGLHFTHPYYAIAVCNDVVCISFLLAEYLKPHLRTSMLSVHHGRPGRGFRGPAVSDSERGDRCVRAIESGTEFMLRLGWCEAGRRGCRHLLTKRYFDLCRIDPRVLRPFSLLLSMRAYPQAVSARSRRDRWWPSGHRYEGVDLIWGTLHFTKAICF